MSTRIENLGGYNKARFAEAVETETVKNIDGRDL